MEEMVNVGNGQGSSQRLLTIEELAGLLQVPKSWIYDRSRLVKVNGFPVLKVGKYLRFDYERVLNWIREENAKRDSER
jgi:excisionase family DNA binding protein